MSKTYDIKQTVVIKTKTGKKDRFGREKWKTVSTTPTDPIKNTTWSDLKKKVYDESKGSKEVFADFKDNLDIVKKKHLKSKTRILPNGDKEITYYG